MSGAYYNEIDPVAAEWLRTLIRFGHIAPGDVDTRSIVDVHPDDLRPYDQCHFFAGIGVWSYALRLAGWPDDRKVWTGSCPCQPFSAAGSGAGFTDERHLWPHWHHLIFECRPGVVFGEQVASKDGLDWLDLVHTDMEAAGYACGAFDLCAAGVGAPHIRQRLYFAADRVGDTNDSRLEGQRGGHRAAGRWVSTVGSTAEASEPSGLADTDSQQPQRPDDPVRAGRLTADSSSALVGLADTAGAGLGIIGRGGRTGEGDSRSHADEHHEEHRPGPTNGYWRDADWLFCRDEKWRAVEPTTFPLALGVAGRVGRLRAYGNAIVAPLAAEVIAAYMEVRQCNDQTR